MKAIGRRSWDGGLSKLVRSDRIRAQADRAKNSWCQAATRSYLPKGRVKGFTVPSFLPFLTVFAFAMIVFLLFFESSVLSCDVL